MDYVDLEQWPRRAQFKFFSGLSFPFYNVTTSLDVTTLHRHTKARGLSFYYALIYATLHVMNGLPDFLYKIRGEQIILHDHLDPSFVVPNGDTHLLKIVNVPYGGTLEEFCSRCSHQVAVQHAPFPAGTEEARNDLVYISCLPWLSFTSLSNEMDCNPDDSIPRVTWGKYEARDGRLLLPYSVQLNHRLLDGWHLGELVNGVQAFLDAF